jgi:D-threonate/D-erythronate kinase
VNVQNLLRSQGLRDCRHVRTGSIRGALAEGSRFLSLDTVVEKDLESIVEETLACGRRILWTGSAGLASALARALYPGPLRDAAPPSCGSLPVLFLVGSTHVVTERQVADLQDRYPIRHLTASSAMPEELSAALRSGSHTILSIERDDDVERLRTLLCASERAFGALLMSGGDTASVICRAIAAQALRLKGEVVMGLPWGILEGGAFDGVPIATKSGGFGAPNALIEVANFFSCRVD